MVPSTVTGSPRLEVICSIVSMIVASKSSRLLGNDLIGFAEPERDCGLSVLCPAPGQTKCWIVASEEYRLLIEPKLRTCVRTIASCSKSPTRTIGRYVSFDGVAELSAVTTDAGDPTSDALVDYYSAVTGKSRDDWPTYREAMVAEQRLLVTFRPTTVTGQING